MQRTVKPFQHECRRLHPCFAIADLLLGLNLRLLRCMEVSGDACQFVLGVLDARGDRESLLQRLLQFAPVEEAGPVQLRAVQFGPAGVGGLVDPVGGDCVKTSRAVSLPVVAMNA